MHQLLVKYLENRCNAHEIDQVLEYLKTEEGLQHLATLMDQEIYEGKVHQSKAVDADYDQLFEQIKNGADIPSESVRKTIPHYKKWYAVAAVASGFLLMTAFVWFLLLSPATTTYQTAYGETKSIILPDNSVVTLNANSSLLVQNDFGKQREVWLEGEAFFEVEKTKSEDEEAYIKFIVHTGRLEVEVLGTSFNVQDREGKTQVVLKSGKVKLRSLAHEELTMAPGELAEVSTNSPALEKKTVNPDIYSSWTEDKLLCHDTPLDEIATVIKHRFGRQVIFQQAALEEMVVSGTLPLHDLSLLREVLQESLNIHIEANENRLIISQ